LTFGTHGHGTIYIYIYIYIYIIIGRSLVLLKAPKSFHELSSAFESTHEVFSKVIYWTLKPAAMARDIKTNKKILGRSLVLLRAPNSSHELPSVLESTWELSWAFKCFQEHSQGPLESYWTPKPATMAQDIFLKYLKNPWCSWKHRELLWTF